MRSLALIIVGLSALVLVGCGAPFTDAEVDSDSGMHEMLPDSAPDADPKTDGGTTDASDHDVVTAHDASPDSDSATTTTDSGTQPDSDTQPDTSDVDTGCGPLDSVSNCGSCGAACSTATDVFSNSCNGSSCSYVCHAGFSDCNAANGADLDGCECASPGCCAGGACQTTHSYGTTTYYDCIPTGTYDEQLGMDACGAMFGSGCTAMTCGGTENGSSYSAQTVMHNEGGTCWMWAYASDANHPEIVGHYTETTTGSCACPAEFSADWY